LRDGLEQRSTAGVSEQTREVQADTDSVNLVLLF